MFRLRISAWPSRCCVPSKPPSTPCPRPSRRAPFRRCCRAATCWASPRPAPARPQPSRCPCCSTSPASASAPQPKQPACPRAGADPRARGPDRAQLRHLRSRPRPASLHRRRRPGLWPPDRDPGARRRHPGRHAGPPARPGRARQREAGACDVPRPRRGRPHVRHGLHQGRAPHRRRGLQAAPDAAVLRHHAGRRRQARVGDPEEPRAGRDRAAGPHRSRRSTSASTS